MAADAVERERGSITVEFALALPAVVMVLGMVLAAVTWCAAAVRVADVASTTARYAAVHGTAAAQQRAGSTAQPEDVAITTSDGWVTVTVTTDSPGWLPPVRATAQAWNGP